LDSKWPSDAAVVGDNKAESKDAEGNPEDGDVPF
jgi:hypothetical protein